MFGISQFIHEIIETHVHMPKIHVLYIISHGCFILLEVISFQSSGSPLMLQIDLFTVSGSVTLYLFELKYKS